MFLDNKYYKWYTKLTSQTGRVLDGYTEKHHIVPRSMGGSDKKDNLVDLTAREHYIAHLLLTRCVTKEFIPKMMYAFVMMAIVKDKVQQRTFKVNSRLFESRKLEANNYKTEFRHTEDAKARIAEKLKGVPKPEFTEDHKRNISLGHLSQVAWNKGLTGLPTTSDKQKAAVRAANIGTVSCFDITDLTFKRVKSDEYRENKDRYLCHNSREFKEKYKESYNGT